MTRDRQVWLDFMLMEEHGLSKVTQKPMNSALVTFGSFVAVGAIPVALYLIPALDMLQQFSISAVLAAIMFFCSVC